MTILTPPDRLRELLADKQGWLFDLDGTLYLGDALIPGADAVVARLRERGARVGFLTNKPIATRVSYAENLVVWMWRNH